MITECPSCKKRFLIMEYIFESSQGHVRCGACMKIFKAFDNRKEPDNNQGGTLAQPSTASRTNTPSTVKKDSKNTVDNRYLDDGRVEPVVLSDDQPINIETLAAQFQSDPLEISGKLPTRKRSLIQSMGWVISFGAAMILAGILYLKWLEHSVDTLPENSLVQHAYHMACGLLRCNLQAKVSDVVLLKLTVYSHPMQNNKLVAEAVIVNAGHLALPWPTLKIQFNDAQGAPVSQRSFAPSDYTIEQRSHQKSLAPSQPTHIKLEIADPGSHAVNYVLDIVDAS